MKTRIKVICSLQVDNVIFEINKEKKIFFNIEKKIQDFSIRKGYTDSTVSIVTSYISIFNSLSPKGSKNIVCQVQKVENKEYKTIMNEYVFGLTEGEK